MIDYTSVEGKAGIECYTLEDLLQETLELGAKGYKLCLENDYFCFNRGGNYTAYFDAPKKEIRTDGGLCLEITLPTASVTEEGAFVLSTPDQIAEAVAVIHERENEVDATPSDVNTAAVAPVQEEQAPAPTPEVKEEEPQATTPRRGRPPRNAT